MAKLKSIGVDPDLHAWITKIVGTTGETVQEFLRRATNMPDGFKATGEEVGRPRINRPPEEPAEPPSDITQADLRRLIRADILEILSEGSQVTPEVHTKLNAKYKPTLDARWFERYKGSSRFTLTVNWEFAVMVKEGLGKRLATGLWGLTDRAIHTQVLNLQGGESL